MPTIKSSTDLRNNYNEISTFCHETKEPVFITKNGRGDLAVMSIDLFNKFMSKYELYSLLDQSESDFNNNRTLSFENSMRNLREELNNGAKWHKIHNNCFAKLPQRFARHSSLHCTQFRVTNYSIRIPR